MLQIAGIDGDAILNALPSSDTLSVYDLALTGASMPVSCSAPATGTLLASFALNSPWAGPAVSGDSSMPVNGLPITSSSITTDGTPAYFRLTSSGTCVMQGTMGRTGTTDINNVQWDITTDGQRWKQDGTAFLDTLNFIALNNDAASP